MSSTEQSTPRADAESSEIKQSLTKGSLVAGLITGITASTCCAGPFLLLTLGISGSWISNFSLLEPLRPWLIGLTLVFLGLAFRKLYLLPNACATDAPCATAATLHKQRIVFWIVIGLIAALIAFPWYGPLLFE